MIGPVALVPLVEDVLRHVFTGDLDQAAAVLDHVADLGDAADMYGLCIAVAETGQSALQAHPSGAATLVRALLAASSAPADPHRLFAARFLAAYGRDDREMTTALFHAAVTAGARARTESVCALLALVSGLHRRPAGPCTEGT
ncbi:hypothetical protein J7E96_28260 [Streptomyces sp. ISL-96]|uniref:hypothetical protein n=1 Tax=Streptomyces sp. ISL-96 TaxID=2819191 RepID=UPI001BEC6292|nr:hypothetical protein [Streptomyces sp. ISL-96]MBT2492334.1 hypothetical protein [Streptomyces sp. ISL-96]